MQSPPTASEAYLTLGDISLSIHRFDPPDTAQTRAGRPALLFFHGGGWKSGSPSQFYPHCHYFAQRGCVTFTAEYRLTEKHGTTPFDALSDCRSAVRWVRENAERFGLDPRRLVVGGGSAGGHLAACCALSRAIDHPQDDLTVSATPDALVLFNPVIDNGPEGYGHEQVKDHWKAFSPLHNVRSGAPPTILFLGDQDHLIPVDTGRDFQRRMLHAGSRCELWVYEGQPHGFFNYRDGNNPWYASTLQEADRFLISLGFLQAPAIIQADSHARGRLQVV